MKIFLTILLFSVVILGGFSYFYINDLMKREVYFANTLEIEIPHNTTGDQVIDKFNKEGLLRPSIFFKYLLRYYIENENKQVYAGHFRLKGKMTNLEILMSLFDEKTKRAIRITIPEGLKLEDYASIFKEELDCDSSEFMELTRNPAILSEYQIEGEDLLGYLMPNTYDFNYYEKPAKVIKKLLNEYEKIWNEESLKKLEQLHLTKKEVTILASIVEAETPLKSEAKTVAGLYLNRLKKGMLLQADPTIQFMLGKKQRVLYKHLEMPHPYNTYLNVGLPPGPINNPGKDAIYAVLNPSSHNFLYMVAIGDGSGRHYFSRNHNDHLKFVSNYRKTKDSLKNNKSLEILDSSNVN